MSLSNQQEEAIFLLLDSSRKFPDPSAANSVEKKLSGAAQVNRFTGCCPSVAVDVL